MGRAGGGQFHHRGQGNLKPSGDNKKFKFQKADVSKPLKVADKWVTCCTLPPRRVSRLFEASHRHDDGGSVGTQNALELALAKDAKFFLASTSECYGDPEVSPQHEDLLGHVNPIGPRGVYDEAKRFSEAMTMAYHRYHEVDTHIVRIFNTMAADAAERRPRAANFVFQALTASRLRFMATETDTQLLLRRRPDRRHSPANDVE